VDHFDELRRFQFPRWLRDTGLAVARLAELIERVGPCVVIGHSQGGEIAARAVAARPDAAQALILLEPSGFVVAGDEARIAAIPMLFVMGDFLERHPIFSALRQAMQDWIQTLKSISGAPALWNLPGASHMLMHDRRSQRTAHDIVEWIKSVTSRTGRTGCGDRSQPSPSK
jgi:pimeloyl-ACP methyl ester carboxylesterase